MTDEITQNDCQGEDDFMAFYTKLSPLEKQLFKAIGIPFQLQDFGHNVIEEDDEYFEQGREQIDRFTDANKVALSKVMSIVRAEIARLQAELNEARDVINDMIGFPFSAEVLDRARAFLTKGETDNG